MSDANQFRQGLACGLCAYLWWGIVPIYFRQLNQVDSGEILAHRIVWAVVLMLGIIAVRPGGRDIARTLVHRRWAPLLGLSACLLAINWLLYIYATVNDHVADASLGYFMLPLVNAFLATVFLGERLRPLHYPALGLVAAGVLVPILALGMIPWIPVSLAVSFGLYGLVRKLIPVDSFTGLSVETILMLPLALGYLYYHDMTKGIRFGQDGVETGLLVATGVVTLLPLLLFTMAIRRLPLLTLNLIQVISPTLQLVVAITWNRQQVEPSLIVALICVLLGVMIFLFDAVRHQQRLRANRREVSRSKNPEIALD